ncbi:MAG: periplasmic heavy metal sensor [Rhodobacteraceae bacterium]|nr:periplasmic heavy metal sensor [Paracoccaceae bacterium]MCW9041902.1 periplasmic heavy metal sensor [Pseudopelagicola sp.]
MSDDMKTSQPSPQTGGGAPKMRRGVRIVLIASLAFNLLIVGLAVGAMLSGGPKAHRDMRLPAHVRALDHEDRRAIGRGIRAAHKDGRLGPRASSAQTRQLADLIEAEVFDRAAVATLMDEIEAAKRSRFEVARDVWLGRVEAMSDDERAAYAERLREVLAQKGKDRPKRD